MKIYFFFVCFVCSSAMSFAQQDTTLAYARPGVEKDPFRSQLKRNVTQKDNSWVLTLTDKKGIIQEIITFADEKLEVRKGPYALYENGTLIAEGNYDKGHRIGDWKSYHPNKKLDESIGYVWGKREGQYRSYWDNGQIKQEGFYQKDQKIGQWKLFLRDGKIASLTKYDEEGEEVEAEYFDQAGIKIKQPATYPGGMQAFYQFLNKEIKYPKDAQEIEGVVKVSFIVKTDGSLRAIKVKESPSPILSKEAIRVLRKSKEWIPGQLLGEPAEMQINIPIKFAK